MGMIEIAQQVTKEPEPNRWWIPIVVAAITIVPATIAILQRGKKRKGKDKHHDSNRDR